MKQAKPRAASLNVLKRVLGYMLKLYALPFLLVILCIIVSAAALWWGPPSPRHWWMTTLFPC